MQEFEQRIADTIEVKHCIAVCNATVALEIAILAAKIRLMKNFGFAGIDDVIYIGTNGRMNEVAAVRV